jgi:hypothetical protein
MRRNGHAGAWNVPEPKSADENLANFVLAALDPALESELNNSRWGVWSC